jgi:hypothetical protein
MPGSTDPTIFLYGKANGDPRFGLWRSIDDGTTWQLIARAPLDLYKSVSVVSGDPDRPGRVYVGFGGTGFVVGDDPAVAGSTASGRADL